MLTTRTRHEYYQSITAIILGNGSNEKIFILWEMRLTSCITRKDKKSVEKFFFPSIIYAYIFYAFMDNFKEKLQQFHLDIESLNYEISKKVIGQHTMIRDILIALFAKGHILIEWAPGLAKTLAVETIAKTLNLNFNRIQFTPDLLPSDLVGSNIYRPEKSEFVVRKGPIFSNFVLADEINRAPSKVQSALLEAMAERQVSIGDTTYKLESPFIVLATQNPIEQEGTFKLPEAQLDRFLLKTVVSYPSEEEELEILKNIDTIEESEVKKIFSKTDITDIQKLIGEIEVSENIYTYIKDIVFFTRNETTITPYIAYPISPRASLSLLKASKVRACLEGREFVLPEDVKEMAYASLRHRIILNYEALADGVEVDAIIAEILHHVAIT